MAGRFIAFEGLDGVGKSTALRLVAAGLRRGGAEVVETREPGGSPGAEEIRALLVRGDDDRWSPRTEALLHTAARAEHVDAVIRPAMAAGRWVLCDRYVGSSLAYQGYGMELGAEFVMELHRLATGGLMPDQTVLLEVPPSIAAARLGRRDTAGEDRYERMASGFWARARAGYEAMAEDPSFAVFRVEASGSPEDVAAAILARLGQAGPRAIPASS